MCDKTFYFGEIDTCENLRTGIIVEEAGEYIFEFKYHNKRITKKIEFSIGDEIIIDISDLNECYGFEFEIFYPNGDLLEAELNGCRYCLFSFKTEIGAGANENSFDGTNPAEPIVTSEYGINIPSYEFPCQAANGDNMQASPSPINTTPLQGSRIAILVNGREHGLGNGTTNKEFYISGDNGLTAKGFSLNDTNGNVQTGDKIFVNTSILGFEIDPSDKIRLQFLNQNQ